ncbi:MAG: hypothetical protein JWO53_319 [Chlamydiia bacterium]|nr:hypothetical protein [Chlamydiia bacterium]
MPGMTIDDLDIGIHVQYARRTELIEQVRQQYHMPEASGVPAQTLIVDIYPKLTELDLLMGVAAVNTPWAYFFQPRRYSSQRRSAFAFHRIIPIFGTAEEEKDEEQRLDSIQCSTPEEEHEKGIIKDCFKQIKQINELLRYIGGRIGQFLQG